jgi:hypothetical protein
MKTLRDTLQLVRTINSFDAMPVRQVARLYHLSEGSRTEYSPYLTNLPELTVKRIPHPTAEQSRPPNVLIVSPRGHKLMRDRGFGDEIKRYGFGHNRLISADHWHSFWVNDILVSALVFADDTPGVTVATRMTDFDFNREKQYHYTVQLGENTKQTVKPDGLVAFSFPDKVGEDRQYLLELETGTNAMAKVRRKVKAQVVFLKEYGFQKTFGSDLFSGFLYIAMGLEEHGSAENHRTAILTNIALALREMNAEEFAPLFRVTSCAVDSTKLFTDPMWYFPGYFDPFRLFVDIS